MKKILFVDDDREVRRFFQNELEHFNLPFSALVAEDGVRAIEILQQEFISVVVTDLKMPRMDGLSLLNAITRDYPDISVIIITGYATEKIKKMALQSGAAGFIEKPFKIERLIGPINAILKNESDGGTLHGVTPGMFLQLVEMEEKTCTIRLTDGNSGKQGVLFFDQGLLLDARTPTQHGKDAAYDIFAWDNVSVAIQNICFQKQDRIKSDLQGILLEAMRRKDEQDQNENEVIWLNSEDEDSTVMEINLSSDVDDLSVEDVRKMLMEEIGQECSPEEIIANSSWDNFLSYSTQLEKYLGGGKLKVGFVDNGSPGNTILLPGRETIILSISPACPRDKIMDLFSR
ncbi:MAG: response regulator [Thermodesulfobacteriota bacterium]|nr:response regulator [Thermodesulfobacteriota bacterium]